MFARYRVVIMVAIAALSGCPSRPRVGVDEPTDGEKLPPAVPAKVEVQRVDPMDANDPSARSPLLDVMREENARWTDALKASGPPAYFLGYLITDRRTVVLEASDGGLVIEDDDSSRALDVDVRV